MLGFGDSDTFGFSKNRKIDETQKGLFTKQARRNTVLVDQEGGGDYESIQDAIDKSDTGTIFLKEDTYILDSTIYLDSKTAIIGESENTILKTTGNFPAITISGKDDCLLSNFKIEGIGATNSSNHGIYLVKSCHRVIIDGIKIVDCGGEGIKILVESSDTAESTTGIIIKNCTIGLQGNMNQHNGIYIVTTSLNTNAGRIEDTRIFNNTISYNAIDGIRLLASDYGEINRQLIYDNFISGNTFGIHIVIAAVNYTNIINNLFRYQTNDIVDSGTNTFEAASIYS